VVIDIDSECCLLLFRIYIERERDMHSYNFQILCVFCDLYIIVYVDMVFVS